MRFDLNSPGEGLENHFCPARAKHDSEHIEQVRAVLQTTFEKVVLEVEPDAAKRIKGDPPSRTRTLLLAEYGGLVIQPHLRPDVVERTPEGYSVEKVALAIA